MKVCIDTTPITPQPSGVGLYILNLLQELFKLQQQEDFHLSITYQPKLLNWLRGNWNFPSHLDTYSGKSTIPIPVRLSNLIFRNSQNLPSRLLTKYLDKPDVMHGTNYSVYPLSSGCRIMTIYDVSFQLYPQYSTAVSKAYFSQIKRNLAWTDLIITISDSAKKDIINCFDVTESNVWVTPLASRYSLISNILEKVNRTIETRADLSTQHVAIPYEDNQPYFLFVGTLEPRKNIVSIVKAFNYLKSGNRLPHKLLLVGRKGWFYDSILEAIVQSPYRDDICHLDYVPDTEMVDLYQDATAFVYPSHYEGFGLPVLEAMSLGCPVITSNTSSIPEVAGNAAIMVCPEDIEELSNALYRVINSSALRQRLIEDGYVQAAKFSWKRTAQSTISAYRSLLS